MKLVLDTNIFISAFYWGGKPRQVLERIIAGADDLYISRKILAELANVLSTPKFKTSPVEIEYFISAVEEIAHKTPSKIKVKNVCRDKADDKILECALATQADYIITGDTDLLVLEQYKRTRIVTPNAYLNLN
ncbi:MAG: putative toxin-antitoxin system toxin component, PIN family [Candidatus Margulisbacteria bacterium]|jgi:putative PIN family toxin of toxin-antitoxin system|nr:putative toxin-antitoxin system toxin component, PIN family [Candidatus Margulisiibacteriota bacterium]